MSCWAYRFWKKCNLDVCRPFSRRVGRCLCKLRFIRRRNGATGSIFHVAQRSSPRRLAYSRPMAQDLAVAKPETRGATPAAECCTNAGRGQTNPVTRTSPGEFIAKRFYAICATGHQSVVGWVCQWRFGGCTLPALYTLPSNPSF